MRIYVLLNIVNGKRYVGQTVGKIEYRLTKHLAEAKNPKNNMILSAAINKYGIEAFEIERDILCKTQTELDNLERQLIKELRTQDIEFGYNILDGGRGRTEKDRQRQSEQMKARFANPEERARVSQHRNKHFANPNNRQKASVKTKAQMTPEMRALLSNKTNAHWQSLSADEQAERMTALKNSQLDRAQKQHEGKTVVVMTPDGDAYTIDRIDFWEHTKKLGMNPSSASSAMRKGMRHKGYRFVLKVAVNEER